MQSQTFKTQWGDKTLEIEVGRFAHQADAACTVRLGDTVVLSTVVLSKTKRPGIPFFPLMVDYEEKYFAAGKIKGSRFIKKEGRPSDEAVLTSRIIDRGIRPLFDQSMRNDIQVICNVLSFDRENDSDVVAMIGASCALHMSQIPWNGPLGSVRIGRVEGGDWIINPTYEEREAGDVDIVVSGTPERLLMVEAGASVVEDETIVKGIEFGLKSLEPVVKLIEEVRSAVGLEKIDPASLNDISDEELEVKKKVEEMSLPFIEKAVEERFFTAPLDSKVERAIAKSAISKDLKAHLIEAGIEEGDTRYGTDLIYDEVQNVISRQILASDRRVDGRGMLDVRPLLSEVGILPRTHGSANFMRGETQILSTTTLAGPSAEQIVDTMEHDIKKRYMHHYAFPPFSVGEAKPMRGPGRREIGHGALAEKALMPVLPSKEDYPYVIRVVSETMGSNGSSSMGSTCGSTLALMDAGVPITAPVAGVAIGLSSTPDMSKWKVFTDLQDLEDGPGGMDFKITGTKDGVTAVQLDTKTIGLTMDIVEEAFKQARDGRIAILDNMTEAIAEPRSEMSQYAPRIESMKIHPDKIREVIGPGGKVINEIIEKTGVDIDIEDDGTVSITAVSAEGIKEAMDMVNMIVAEAEVGKTYKGTVVRLMDFGAFVEILPKKDGLVHVSEMAPWRVEKVTDLVQEGDTVFVKVVEIDSMGRTNLSMKQAEGNEELYSKKKPAGGGSSRPNGRSQGGSKPSRPTKRP